MIHNLLIGQNELSLLDAIEIGMWKNYEIQISKKNQTISKIKNKRIIDAPETKYIITQEPIINDACPKSGCKVSKILIKIATRNDNFYAWRCLEALKINTDDGLVRLSLTHYNNMKDSGKVIEALKKV